MTLQLTVVNWGNVNGQSAKYYNQYISKTHDLPPLIGGKQLQSQNIYGTKRYISQEYLPCLPNTKCSGWKPLSGSLGLFKQDK